MTEEKRQLQKDALLGRLASLDLLRGVAALAVAIPHYLMLGSQDWPVMQVISILAVEVFFVLSGFVLAPQILHCVTSAYRSDIGIFLVRRWMRTIPPYYVALVAITILSGNIFKPEFLYYIVYLQNLTTSLPETRDYFAVAWSLSVEEWFYVAFAVLVIAARLAGLGRRGFINLVLLFALAFIAARSISGDMANWDAAVRRVTIFRLDAIAFGFLLYVALQRLEQDYRRFAGPLFTWLLTCLALAAVSALAFATGWAASVSGSTFAQHAYPFTSGLFGVVLIFALTFHRDAFQQPRGFAAICYFLGKVSYTIYLFHLIVILLLRPRLGDLGLVLQLAIYVAALIGFCTAFFYGFESPILAARPRYRGEAVRKRPAAVIATPAWFNAFDRRLRTTPARIIGLFLAIAGGALCNWSFHAGQALLFYAGMIATAFGLIVGLIGLKLWRHGFFNTIRIGLALFALTLPAVDYLYSLTLNQEVRRPGLNTYSFRQAQSDPAAFQAWWSFFVDEFNKGAKANIEEPDPQGKLPFLQKPNARSKFFDTEIRINNRGFRGPDFDVDKGSNWRIFVTGESPTFGTLTTADQRAWPTVLQELIDTKLACRRPVQVINAGAIGYNLKDSIERLKRFILPLKPDMVVSYHGFNNLAMVDPVLMQMPQPPQWQRRASPLIGEVMFKFKMLRWARQMQAFNETHTGATKFSSEYTDLYRELVDLGKANGFTTVLANLSTVVTGDSPREVIDFYGRVFMPIARILPAVAEHNRQVEQVARDTGTPFIDTTPGLAGQWDADYFYDIVHFTQKGSDVLAKHMFDGIAPLLRNNPDLSCTPRAP
ncbi:acyltransferase family protein [Roseiarcaceae bacterium H3SJ34-1]|uniref:acyltransferase family protein n=1 Tax=Terripilifer ovatus TaxID=3032367 RepID=UPI003AB9790C|nr:acyltransferase family protein [Roseiarcaceae bacterium H3SJ34-1]